MTLWKLSASALSSMLARGETSAREVIQAHIDRIADVDGKVGAFTEVLAEQALAEADASDARRRASQPRGPLDGVPVTFKECFDFKGRATTLGLPSWRGRIAAEDAALVTALREAGAVVLGRTNLSQTMLFIEARNPLFGQTANPWSLAHTPGGSSGGEGAAIASGMSPLGFGTDIGGSIRTPSHFCGICGLMPTPNRLPMRGYRASVGGQETVRAGAGPMGRTVGDLRLFFEALDPRRLAALDTEVSPVPWTDPRALAVEALRVGFYRDDGILAPSPGVARAVERAAEALRARGCAVREIAPPEMGALLRDYFGALSADGGAGILAQLRGGAVDPSLEPLRAVVRLPPLARAAAIFGARVAGQKSAALLLSSIGRRSVAEFWKLTERIRVFRRALLDRMQREQLDAILCPPYATAAFPHGGSRELTLASSYAMLCNATQLPAGVVPVTRVRAGETERRVAPGRRPPRDRLERLAAAFDARSAGLPVGAQVFARPWRDDVVLAVMAAVEAEVSADPDYPRTPVDPA